MAKHMNMVGAPFGGGPSARAQNPALQKRIIRHIFSNQWRAEKWARTGRWPRASKELNYYRN